MSQALTQSNHAINPFEGGKTSLAAVEVESQRAIAEVQAAMILARKFPRDPVAAMDRILNSCTRPTLAEGALYSYSRGGSDITGPSIRLAEALAQSWGNIQYGIREIEQRDGESTVEAFAWDVETNTRQVKVFQVPHVRYTKNRGNTALSDPRDIYELVANQGARRLRSCILGIIPGDVTEEAVKQCDLTLSQSADVSPENVQKMVAAFEERFGVSKAQIEKKIQRRIDAINPAQMVQLKKIFASLKDGMSSANDWFESDRVTETEPRQEKPNWMKVKEGGSINDVQVPAPASAAAPPPVVEEPAPQVQMQVQAEAEPEVSPRQEFQMLVESEGLTVREVEKAARYFKLLRTTMPLQSIGDISDKAVSTILTDTRAFVEAAKGGAE